MKGKMVGGEITSDEGPGCCSGWVCQLGHGKQEDTGQRRLCQGSEMTPELSSFHLTVFPGLIPDARNVVGLLNPQTLLVSSATHLLCALLIQVKFGRNGQDCPGKFCLFQSETKNLLFNDNTECLAKLHGKTTYETYLGREYVTAVGNLRQCSTSRKWTIAGSMRSHHG